jgi:hypothetical protein
MDNQLMELDDISYALNAISDHTKFVPLILFIPCILLQSTDPQTKALNTIHNNYYNSYMFRHRGAISGSLRTKHYKPNMFITNM